MRKFLHRFLNDEFGSNAIEYGLIVAFVSLAIVGGATIAGSQLGSLFSHIGTELSTVVAST